MVENVTKKNICSSYSYFEHDLRPKLVDTNSSTFFTIISFVNSTFKSHGLLF